MEIFIFYEMRRKQGEVPVLLCSPEVQEHLPQENALV
jgi:hypothetical protein